MEQEPLKLRDLINTRLNTLEQHLEGQRFMQEFQQIKMQVGQLSEATQELERRVIALEQHKGMASWVFRQGVTVVVIVVIVWLIGVFR